MPAIRYLNVDLDVASGITYRTLRRWIVRGEKEIDRVEKAPRAKIRKKERPYVDFVNQYDAACSQRRQTLIQTATLVAMGHYQIEETQITQITKNGAVVQEIEVKKVKEVGPDGNLAMKLLNYDQGVRQQDSGEQKQNEDSRLPILERILHMSPDELRMLNENLEAMQ